MANIQIDEALFTRLCLFHLFDGKEVEPYIKKALQAKLDATMRRMEYTTYKTAATPEEREKARQAYLDRAGIRQDFRWTQK